MERELREDQEEAGGSNHARSGARQCERRGAAAVALDRSQVAGSSSCIVRSASMQEPRAAGVAKVRLPSASD